MLPDNLQIIKKATFKGCVSLKTVTIPSTVEFIYQEAFADCSGLESVKALPEAPPFLYDNSFSNYSVPLRVPEGCIEAYRTAQGWKNFKSIAALDGSTPEPSKCANPTISYQNGTLTFYSETEGVEYISEITDADIKKYNGASVPLTATYHITVYATKAGYYDSDVVTATLCWIDAEPTNGGFTDGVASVAARAVLIQSHDGMLTVQGADDGQQVSVYSTGGVLAGSAVSRNGQATVATSLQPGTVAIVKIGNKSVKMVVK